MIDQFFSSPFKFLTDKRPKSTSSEVKLGPVSQGEGVLLLTTWFYGEPQRFSFMVSVLNMGTEELSFGYK